MSEKFEVLKTTKASASQLRKTVRNLRGVPDELKLDAARAQALVIGPRLWTFVMTKEAVTGWQKLGTEKLTLGVIASGLDRPYLQRVLVALPATANTVKLEMHDRDGRLLWTGSGQIKGEELEFSMPITRPGVRAKGMMAGSLTADGRLTLHDSRLPKPARKRKPTFESKD
jgi:hypothetical protein